MNSRVNMNKHNGLPTLFWRRVRELCEVNNGANDRLKSETIDLSQGRQHTSFDGDENKAVKNGSTVCSKTLKSNNLSKNGFTNKFSQSTENTSSDKTGTYQHKFYTQICVLGFEYTQYTSIPESHFQLRQIKHAINTE